MIGKERKIKLENTESWLRGRHSFIFCERIKWRLTKFAPNVALDDTCKSIFYDCLFESQHNYPNFTHTHFNVFLLNFTYDPPQGLNRCYVSLIFVQGLFLSISGFIY